jgi:outer membrane usher protein
VGATLEDGLVTLNALLQRSLPAGNGVGYRFSASTGRFEQVYGEVTLRTDFGDYDANLTWTDGRTGLRLSTIGSIGIAGGTAFASRHIDRSFAQVRVGDYAGVHVYVDNQLVGKTGPDGRLLVPGLRSYDRNVIRIDANDLPLDAQIAGEQQTVRPADRQGVLVDFKARPSRAVLIRVQLSDGRPLPTGSSVKLQDRDEEFVSAPGGDVYFTGIDRPELALATWADGSCELRVPISGNSERPVKCSPITQ